MHGTTVKIITNIYLLGEVPWSKPPFPVFKMLWAQWGYISDRSKKKNKINS